MKITLEKSKHGCWRVGSFYRQPGDIHAKWQYDSHGKGFLMAIIAYWKKFAALNGWEKQNKDKPEWSILASKTYPQREGIDTI